MARITSVIATSHSPFLFEPAEWWSKTWSERSATGGYAAGVPVDSHEENVRKRQRTDAGFAKLRDVFQAAKPDVMVIFGDDQEEQFDSRNHPALAVYIGGDFAGYKAVAYSGMTPPRTLKPRTAEHWTQARTNPALAKAVLRGLMDSGFDPAFMTDLPNKEFGMGHAFMRPTGRLTDGRFDVPIVPVLVNALYPPQPSAARCVAAGRAVRRAIEAWPENVNVVVVGSGGLWHTPGAPEAYLDEDFDQMILEGVRSGDAYEMAKRFDEWRPSPQREHLRCFQAFQGKTGMKGGIGSGAGEARNWIMAAAVADRPGQVIDYIPIYASPCGIGFAHWEM